VPDKQESYELISYNSKGIACCWSLIYKLVTY
jgi:hypothetical protein